MKEDGADDGSGELRCWWKLAVLAKSLGKNRECLFYCNKVLELGNKKSVYDRQKERIGKASDLMKEMSKSP